MTASTFPLKEAEAKFQNSIWATQDDLLAQLLSWELNNSFGHDTQEKISYLIDKLKIRKNTQYSLEQTDEDDKSELLIFRRDEVKRDVPPKLQ